MHELADTIGTNFQVVPIDGFDELMNSLWELREQQAPDISSDRVAISVTSPTAATLDMQPVEDADLNEIEWASTRSRIVNYCKEMKVRVPSDTSREWVTERLCQFDLAVRRPDQQVRLTTAGHLLFARKPQERVQNARVTLRIQGQDQVIEGDLWNQLDTIINGLTEFNRPFRLKGDTSETVFPYPPLALKEVIVNALVHRSYHQEQHIVIEVESHRIQVTNPGGLVETVILQAAGTSLQEQIRRGKRGIRGYRNPVIADLFYSARDMDKKGSGLADVQRLVTEGGGQVEFGQITDNTTFKVSMYSRPEAVDEVTGTATPLVVSTKFAGNLLELLEMPSKVWRGTTKARTIKDVWTNTTLKWLPPFIVQQPDLISFYNLNDEANPLRDLIDLDEIKEETLVDFCAGADGDNRLVELLNQQLIRHLQYRGLVVDRRRRRAYFRCTATGDGRRTIPYQARLRRATRTVTKPIISPSTQKVRYWEHEAFSFGFERFGDTWTLQILPGYVFTVNGSSHLLDGARVNKLSTKRASRDYNSQVHHDLVFWSWVLSGGEQGSFSLTALPQSKEAFELQGKPQEEVRDEAAAHDLARRVEAPLITLRSNIPTVTVSNVPVEADEDEDAAFNAREQAESIELEEELAQLAEEQTSSEKQADERGA